jgi:hypothetical protein
METQPRRQNQHIPNLPLALGLGLAAGLAFGARTGPRRRQQPPSLHEPDTQALVTYLREHLSGADAAIRVVDRLRRTEPSDQLLFEWLYDEFNAEHRVVQGILNRFGAGSGSPKRLLARASAEVITRLAGGARGDLSLFRTLEALAIGVQGKRCMWRALQSLGEALEVPGGRNLFDLEAAAVRQWETIERRRFQLASRAFAAATLAREA